jgi:hypothetical protein
MGRPLKKTFFGSFNTDGVGGEGVATATVGTQGTGYSASTAVVTFGAPQIAGGSTATGTVVIGNVTIGNVSGITITSAGSGYTSAPTFTITGANTSPANTFATTLTSNAVLNAINANAWVSGASVGKAADIVKQAGSRSFRVTNADGTSNCKLVTTATPEAAGEMTITATFADNTSTFSIAKITDHLVYDAAGNTYLWADYSGSKPAFATASNATVPPTVSISNN